LLLVGVATGAAGAQAVLNLRPARTFDTGLFSVSTRDHTDVNVTLTGEKSNIPSQVVVSIFDPDGGEVTSRFVSLTPGQSATLSPELSTRPGRYRARVDLINPTTVTTPRGVATTIEILDEVTAIPRNICPAAYPDDGVRPRP
jgi:hypothetical protein